jgi:hypothetical protein
VNALAEASIPYMLTGSHVTSVLGEPRSTHDVDVVVQIQAVDVTKLSSAFPSSDFAFDEIAAREAIVRGDQFQLMEFSSGDKIDFRMFRDKPFDRSAFSRRYLATIAGISLSFLARRIISSRNSNGPKIMKAKGNIAMR